MKKKLFAFGLIESILMVAYKIFFEFYFLKIYMDKYAYLYDGEIYEFNANKWIISNILLVLFVFLLLETNDKFKETISWLLRFVYGLCIIPMLSVYAFFYTIDFKDIIYPSIYWIIFVLLMKCYANDIFKSSNYLVKIPFRISKISNVIMWICIGCATVIWTVTDFPIITNLSMTNERRMIMRADSLPTLLNYMFMILGATVFPYLFAKYLNEKNIVNSVLSGVCGFLLFCVNGMKTWLVLYIVAIGMIILYEISGKSKRKVSILIECTFVAVTICCYLISKVFDVQEITALMARVIVMPNSIGFQSISFFEKNELLFLRESILRGVFETPYVGGSDFYIKYGANSTLTSSRLNNGLWGDAFRNFGYLGMFIYPFAAAKIFQIVEYNSQKLSGALRLFVIFVVLWSAINASFFTWLLTGGVLVIILLLKIEQSNAHIR